MLITFKKTQKKLIKGLKKTNSGRNNQGRITVRFKGGCNKRKYRVIDFSYKQIFPVSQVLSIEYDPYRSANICLVKNLITNKLIYILAPANIEKGNLIISFKTISNVIPEKKNNLKENITKILKILYLKNLNKFTFIDNKISDINFELLTYLFMKKQRFFRIPLINKIGSVLPLFLIPKGEAIFNIESRKNSLSNIARSAGTFANIVYQMGDNVVIKLPSGNYTVLDKQCFGVIGRASNNWHNKKVLKKASSCYNRNHRPHVRGVAMNPIDHPHGGGEGKTSGGRPSVTPWGIPTKGFKTTKKKTLDKYQLKELLLKATSLEKKNNEKKNITTENQLSPFQAFLKSDIQI